MKTLRQNQAEISAYGVKSLALFGSVARGEARLDSDVDLLVEFERLIGFFGLVALQQRLEELLGWPDGHWHARQPEGFDTLAGARGMRPCRLGTGKNGIPSIRVSARGRKP